MGLFCAQMFLPKKQICDKHNQSEQEDHAQRDGRQLVVEPLQVGSLVSLEQRVQVGLRKAARVHHHPEQPLSVHQLLAPQNQVAVGKVLTLRVLLQLQEAYDNHKSL